MKRLLIFLTLILLSSSLVLADEHDLDYTTELDINSLNLKYGVEGKCYVNNEKIPCGQFYEEYGETIEKWEGILFWMVPILIGVLLIFTIFSIWMVVDCAKRENFPSKTKWILFILLVSPIGAIFYYFKIKRKSV